MKKYICTVCQWVYDPAIGDPDNGVEPGTAWEDVPDDWLCPECGVPKDLFEELPRGLPASGGLASSPQARKPVAGAPAGCASRPSRCSESAD